MLSYSKWNVIRLYFHKKKVGMWSVIFILHTEHKSFIAPKPKSDREQKRVGLVKKLKGSTYAGTIDYAHHRNCVQKSEQNFGN